MSFIILLLSASYPCCLERQYIDMWNDAACSHTTVYTQSSWRNNQRAVINTQKTHSPILINIVISPFKVTLLVTIMRLLTSLLAALASTALAHPNPKPNPNPAPATMPVPVPVPATLPVPVPVPVPATIPGTAVPTTMIAPVVASRADPNEKCMVRTITRLPQPLS